MSISIGYSSTIAGQRFLWLTDEAAAEHDTVAWLKRRVKYTGGDCQPDES